jgi:hypothetical protein
MVVWMIVGAMVFHRIEFPAAEEESKVYYKAFDKLMHQFAEAQYVASASADVQAVNVSAAQNSTTGSQGSSGGEDQVKLVLDLLNAMGTCDGPPKLKADMDFGVFTSMLYSFYIGSTMGYGDINVRTQAGKAFVLGYSPVAMWLFGWFATSLAAIITAALAEVALRVRACWSWCRNFLRRSGNRGSSSPPSTATNGQIGNIDTALTLCAAGIFMAAAGGVIATVKEDDQTWSLLGSVWFVFVSCTTIGFGDMTPNRSVAYRDDTLIELVILAFGLSLFSIATSALVSIFVTEVEAAEHLSESLAKKAADLVEHTAEEAAAHVSPHHRT